MPNLEIRDAYFTRLKNKVEEFKSIHKRKVSFPGWRSSQNATGDSG